MSLPKTDAFTGANGTTLHTYDAGWVNNSATGGTMEIQSNACCATSGNQKDTVYYWATDTPGAAQYAQAVVIANTNVQTYQGPAVRIQNGTPGACYNVGSAGGDRGLYKDLTVLLFGDTGAIATNDLQYLEANGSTLVYKINGSTITTQTDSTYSAGSFGIYAYNSVGVQGQQDSFEGGNLAGGETITVDKWFSSPQPNPRGRISFIQRLGHFATDMARMLDPENPQIDKWSGFHQPVPAGRRVPTRSGFWATDPARLLDVESPQLDKWRGFGDPMPDKRRQPAREGMFLSDPARLLDPEVTLFSKWIPAADPVPDRRRDVRPRLGIFAVDAAHLLDVEATQLDKWIGSYEPFPSPRRVPARVGWVTIDPARLLDTELAQVDKWLPSADPVPARRRVPVREGMSLSDPARLLDAGTVESLTIDKWLSNADPRPNARRRPMWQGWFVQDPARLLDAEATQVDKWAGSYEPFPNRRRVPTREGAFAVDPTSLIIVMPDEWWPSANPVPDRRRTPTREGFVSIDPHAFVLDAEAQMSRWLGFSDPVPSRRGDVRLRLGGFATDARRMLDVEAAQLDKWIPAAEPRPGVRRRPWWGGWFDIDATALMQVATVTYLILPMPPPGFSEFTPTPPAGYSG